MIIIEGCDGTGKSTLAKRIIELYPDFTYHHETSKDAGFERYKSIIGTLNDKTVCDRLYLGELVYPVIFPENRRPLTIDEWDFLEMKIQNYYQNSILVLCDAETSFIENVFQTRGETFINAKDIPKILTLFRSCYKYSKLQKTKFYLSNDNLINTFVHNLIIAHGA